MSSMKGQKKPGGSDKKKHVLQDVLKATSSDDQNRPSDFGSIRFKGSRRPMPSKYARIASSHKEKVSEFLRPLLIETWGLRPPRALISVLGRSGAQRNPLDPTKVFDATGELLVFARGLAEAATTTNAWVVTDGLADGVAAVCGRALRESNVPLLGITPWRSVADHSEIEEKKNGQVHLYDHNNDASAPLRFCGCKKSIASPGGFSRTGAACACPPELVEMYDQHMLEGNHTHFLFVDDGVLKPRLGSEMPLREAMERHLADAHLESGEDERMPLVFLVINGDESTLRAVVDALDPTKGSMSAESVLVLSDSGGAAHDIQVYCHGDGDLQGSNAPGTLPIAGSGRSADYVREAALLLPRLKELGLPDQTGKYPEAQMLGFFSAETDEQQDLDLAVQAALLKDCKNSAEELMLAVAWGDPVTLRAQLEKAQAEDDETSKRHSRALEVALINTDLPTVELLLNFKAPPADVRLERLFCDRLNRYDRMPECWTGVGFVNSIGQPKQRGSLRLLPSRPSFRTAPEQTKEEMQVPNAPMPQCPIAPMPQCPNAPGKRFDGGEGCRRVEQAARVEEDPRRPDRRLCGVPHSTHRARDLRREQER